MNTKYLLITFKLWVKLDFIKKKTTEKNYILVKEIQLAGFNFVRCVRGNKVIFYFGERGPFFLTFLRNKIDFNT